MLRYVIAYFATLVVFVAIDSVWLTSMANVLYRPILKDILVTEFRLAPAIFFYLLYPLGLLIFAVSPALRSGNWNDALIYGALFGFFAYATYDLTNQATLKNWETKLTLIDLAWGSFVSGASATLGYVITSYLDRMFR
jgi:uncharacterized membrane protein